MTAFAHLEEQAEQWHCDPKDKDPRSEIQRVVAFRSAAKIVCPAVHIEAVPNAARRTRWEVMQAKREGMSAGALDHTITWPGRGIAFIEWKDGKTMPSPNQVDRLNLYVRQGHSAGVFRQEWSALEWLRGLGAPFVDRVS